MSQPSSPKPLALSYLTSGLVSLDPFHFEKEIYHWSPNCTWRDACDPMLKADVIADAAADYVDGSRVDLLDRCVDSRSIRLAVTSASSAE